jgi:hypothetical protein
MRHDSWLPFWPATLQPLALVANPRLGLWQLSFWECVLFSSYVPFLSVHVFCNPCFLFKNVFYFLLMFLFYPFTFFTILAFFLRMYFIFFLCSSYILSCFLQSLLSSWECVMFLYHPFEVFYSSCFLLGNSFFCFSFIPWCFLYFSQVCHVSSKICKRF